MQISPRYAPGTGRWASSPRRGATAMLAAIALVLTALAVGFTAPRATAATCGTTSLALHQPTRSIGNTLTIKNPGSQCRIVGMPVSLQIQASDPGQMLYFSAAGLPAGLSISPTGLISGIPATAGVGAAVVTVADTSGISGSISFTWTVVNPGNLS